MKEKLLNIIRDEKPHMKNLTIIVDNSLYSFNRSYLMREINVNSYDEKMIEILLDFFIDHIFSKHKVK